jgi:hypothetical protein
MYCSRNTASIALEKNISIKNSAISDLHQNVLFQKCFSALSKRTSNIVLYQSLIMKTKYYWLLDFFQEESGFLIIKEEIRQNN